MRIDSFQFFIAKDKTIVYETSVFIESGNGIGFLVLFEDCIDAVFHGDVMVVKKKIDGTLCTMYHHFTNSVPFS